MVMTPRSTSHLFYITWRYWTKWYFFPNLFHRSGSFHSQVVLPIEQNIKLFYVHISTLLNLCVKHNLAKIWKKIDTYFVSWRQWKMGTGKMQWFYGTYKEKKRILSDDLMLYKKKWELLAPRGIIEQEIIHI